MTSSDPTKRAQAHEPAGRAPTARTLRSGSSQHGGHEARVAVVIVAYDSAAHLATLLPQLQEFENVKEIVVIDHGSDGSADLAARSGAQVFRDPSNPGFGAGQNRGRRMTTAPYVLMLNPDAMPVERGIDSGLDLLEAETDVGVVQGVIRDPTTGLPARSAGIELSWFHLVGRAVQARRLLAVPALAKLARRSAHLEDHVNRVRPEATDVAALSAVAILARRSAIESVDGFDEGYFLYAEDLDLSARLRQSGWRLVTLPDEWSDHAEGSSSGTWWIREYRWWGGAMRFAALHYSAVSFSLAIGAAIVQWARMCVVRPSGWRKAARSVLVQPVRTRRNRRSGF